MIFSCRLCVYFESAQINSRFDDWQDEIQTLLDEVEQKSGLSLLHTTLYY